MRLAVSAMAWRSGEDEPMARLLARLAIDAIDVVPTRYFKELTAAGATAIAQVRQAWARRGIEITGMQSLMMGTTGLNVFGSPACQAAMHDHLAAVCRIGAGLGARRLVLGAPGCRDRRGLDDRQAHEIACRFFSRLGDIARRHGVRICLEPCPLRYGANFMTDSAQTAAVVQAVAHPAIGMQFDTGALALNGEDPMQVLGQYAGLIGHVHLSEPGLLGLGAARTRHDLMARALMRHLPAHVAAIEVLARDEAARVLKRSIKVAIRHYRPSCPPCQEARPCTG